ncbi:hypothetical protein HY628_00475, partial [Candidatus Uhrbacteria bacterium]|nr:hypothetical protein [Candidatus Uhrbacteria bacterium]
GLTDTTVALVSDDVGDYVTISVTDAGNMVLDTATAASDISMTPVDDLLVTPGDDYTLTLAAAGNDTVDAATTTNTTNSTSVGTIDFNITSDPTDGGTNSGVYIDYTTVNNADVGTTSYRALTVSLTNAEAAAGDNIHAVLLSNADSTGATDGLLALQDTDTSGNPTNGIVFLAGDDTDIDFTNGLNFDAADMSIEIVLENAEQIHNQTNGTIVLEDGGGTDILAGSLTAFQINLDDTATYTETVCHNGADGATGVQNIGDCNVSGGGDVAEFYASDGSLEPGDVVMLTGEAYETIIEERVKISKASVTKSTAPYQASVLGVVSTEPGLELAIKAFAKHENKMPVAILGRVPVKVTDESGAIQPGDFITSSSTPGYAMKATKSGWIIGVALQSFAGGGTGKVIVNVNPFWWNAPVEVTVSQNPDGTLSANDLDMQGGSILNVKAISSASGKWSISEDGAMVVNELTVGSAENPTGVTLFDKVNGLPFCVMVEAGGVVVLPGACGATSAPAPAPAPTAEPAPEPAPTTEPAPAPTAEPAPEPAPTTEPAPAPTAEPAPELAPTTEPAPAPTTEPAPEPAPEPVPTP